MTDLTAKSSAEYPSGGPNPRLHGTGDRGMSEDIENKVSEEEPAVQAEQDAVESQPGSEASAGEEHLGLEDHLDIDAVNQALKEANEKVLRTQAELDNFRKRARRELEDSLKYAQLPLARDLLMVLDNLNLALNAAADNEAASGLAEGVKMVADQLVNALNSHQIFAIESVGQPFDPNQHEAIQMEASQEYEANTVSREIRSGYRLHDRVIRPAQVFVSTGAGSSE